MKCQLVSTRARGTDSVEPMEASDDPKSGSFLMRMNGKPKSWGPAIPVFNPIVRGSKPASSGKNPSVKRLYPKRASLTLVDESTFK